MTRTASTNPDAPSVSIGMPTYNAERTIRLAIDGLLEQSFGNFELVISDNASSDNTWSIIEEYAQRDPRIVPMRQAKNIGANGNYSAVFRVSRGRYFKWASSNDWCAPDFLDRCVACLNNHQDIVLVAPRTRLFEDVPNVYTEYTDDHAFDQPDAVERFTQVSQRLALNNVVNGLVRSTVLRRTRLIEHYPGADIVLVAHLALLGKIALLDEPLFYRRMEAETATRLMTSEAVHRHHYPQSSARALFRAWRYSGGWVRAALSADLSARDVWRASKWALRMAYWSRNDLGSDVLAAMRYATGRGKGSSPPTEPIR
jgi:glycosyltransferase involved in cell wall biosynthesis